MLFLLLTALISKFISGVIISAGANVVIDKVMDPAGAPQLIDPSLLLCGHRSVCFLVRVLVNETTAFNQCNRSRHYSHRRCPMAYQLYSTSNTTFSTNSYAYSDI